MEPKFLVPFPPAINLLPLPHPNPATALWEAKPTGADTHRLVKAHVEELLVPLLDLWPGPVPQLPSLALQAA